jgi:hypothetical protein
MDAFAAFLRYDAPGGGRCLSRLAASVLAGKLRPAAQALADAVGIVLAEEARAAGEIDPAFAVSNFTVSLACLLGQCRTGGISTCTSVLCEHDCHTAPS